MSILCAFGGHEADQAEVYNSGYYFSACRRCRTGMIRSGPAWRAVPRGHKVVWKGGSHSHSIEPDYGPVLPTLHRDANLPALKPSFASWSRQLVQVAVPGLARTNGGGGARAAVSEEEPEEKTYPYLLALAAIVGAGLHLVMNFRAVRGEF
jgi:hypothetical protein